MNFKAGLPWVAALAGMLVMDRLWLGLVAADFYRGHLGHLMYAVGEKPAGLWFAAAGVYASMLFAVGFFAVGPLPVRGALGRALGRGALMGALIFMVYEGTNYAFLYAWPAVVIWVDVLWGACLLGVAGGIFYAVRQRCAACIESL